MSLVLQTLDDEAVRFEAIEFGAGGVVINSDKALAIGTLAEVKLFLEEEAAAVFCYGEVIACHPCENGYQTSLVYTCIREEDQEVLVRATLHLQTQQLKKRHQNSN